MELPTLPFLLISATGLHISISNRLKIIVFLIKSNTCTFKPSNSASRLIIKNYTLLPYSNSYFPRAVIFNSSFFIRYFLCIPK